MNEVNSSAFILNYLLVSATFEYIYMGLFEYNRQTSASYDYVIIGGGTAGLVLANRLTEMDSIRVLVLESGGSGSDYIRNPLTTVMASSNETQSELQPDLMNSYNKSASISWANILGGGTAVNIMAYVRGSPQDYDDWAASGAIGWSFKEVLPYFKKSENMLNQSLAGTKYHGKDGPIDITEQNPRQQISEAWLRSGVELGYKVGDYNSNKPAVFSRL